MKFLSNKKLRHLGGYLLALSVLVFVAEYFILDNRIKSLEEAELKKEFTRILQLSNQEIASSVQNFLNGDLSAPELASQIDLQEHRLKILAYGGRVEQTADFVEPLSRLPKITFFSLRDDWESYKRSIYVILDEQKQHGVSPPNNESNRPDSVITPEVASALPVTNLTTVSSGIRTRGLSLTMKRWYDKLMTDLEEEVQSEKSALKRAQVTLTILNVVFAGSFFFLFLQFVIRPLRLLKNNLASHQQTKEFPGNEIGDVAHKVNDTIENLQDATEFVLAIGKGDLTMQYKQSLDGGNSLANNKLAESLILMQQKLRELNEEEQKRQWANEGLAKFVDILRASNNDLHTLGDKVVNGLVQYTRSNQGALYILNDEDEANKVLELVSLFAYDIKKHEHQRVKPGQGILGQAYLERETMYLTDLPEEYVRITSGLGGANPTSILVVPLKVDKHVYGLVELASFHEFKSHEIAFVEKLGESIASTLASVRAAQKQKHLIEQFQTQTEQMRAQEEEMRQNMEELQATQEEVVRKEKSYIQRIEELETQLNARPERVDLDRLNQLLEGKEREYQHQLNQLQQLLEEKNKKGDDWEVIQELERTLRFNLEALRISEEEMQRKPRI